MTLNKNLDRSFIENMYKSFKLLEKTKTLTYDPGLNKDILFIRSDLLVECWRHYFKELYLFLHKDSNKETVRKINNIFANELYSVREDIYKNATFARIAFNALRSRTKKYKTYVKN